MSRLNRRFAVTKVTVADEDGNGDDGTVHIYKDTRADTVTAEEPLEIRHNGATIATTMRTPGHDVELAHGFLFSEGHIRTAEDIVTARYCAGTNSAGENTYNVLDIGFARPLVIQPRLNTTTSACGVCGTAEIDDLRARLPFPLNAAPLDPRVVAALPDKLRAAQQQFHKTGGIHAAAACTPEGELVVVREDIGRHNAADKVIGALLIDASLPATDLILMMSSRASYELVQKAAMAGFGSLIAVSAASSLAVETARELGMNLIGFARGNKFNLYAGNIQDYTAM